MKKKKSKKYSTVTFGADAYGVKGGAAIVSQRKKAKKKGK